MTVRANHITLGDFFQNFLDRIQVATGARKLKFLLSANVVKIHNAGWVNQLTIRARDILKRIDEHPKSCAFAPKFKILRLSVAARPQPRGLSLIFQISVRHEKFRV